MRCASSLASARKADKSPRARSPASGAFVEPTAPWSRTPRFWFRRWLSAQLRLGPDRGAGPGKREGHEPPSRIHQEVSHETLEDARLNRRVHGGRLRIWFGAGDIP